MGFTAALFSLGAMGLLEFSSGARTKTLVWGLPACVLTMFVLFVFLPSNHLIGRFAQLSYTEEATTGRVQLWRETLHLARDYPLFGCGLGSYESAFTRYKESAPMSIDDYAHNDYVQLLAEGGIIGVALMLMIVGRVLRRASRAFTLASGAADRYLALACIGSLSAIMLHSVVDFSLHIPSDAMILAWICAILCSIRSTRVQHLRDAGLPIVIEAE
jgi:O-antigen ligase